MSQAVSDPASGAGSVPATCFEYQRASTWADAVELMQIWEGDGKILAGGQSLVPMLNLRLTFPAALIDVNQIDAGEPHLDGGDLVIPAMTRHRVLVESPVVRTHAPLLAHAVQFVGNVRVRNRGTIGGSLSHADPTAEIGAAVLALGGTVVALGPAGRREIPAAEFFRTYLTTALEEFEVLTEVRIPSARHGSFGFHEVVRRFSDFATVSVSVQATGGAGDPVTDLRVALGGVADRPVLVEPELLAPALKAPDDATAIGSAAQAVAAWIDPDSDLHGTAEYRRRLVAVHTRRLLTAALSTSNPGGES